jgi:pimeloyl-ACP methyl ester carboxylesterase
MPLDLAAAEYGRGSPLLILHGLFGSGRNWTSVAQKLEQHRVFTLDLRNHGASPWADAMDYEAMADDVRAFLRARGLDRAAVIGHSMGGKTAMITALRHGEMVARLIVVDVAPVAYRPTLLAYIRAMQAVDLQRVTRRSDVDAQLAEAVPDADDRAFLLQNLVLEAGGARWRLNLQALEHALPDISGFPELPRGISYPGPALFVAGGRSDYVRTEHESAIRRWFPYAEIARVPDAGHWVHAERPEAFLRIVTPFLAGRSL